ncbi:MAG: TetR/AcrR family transcriptional regulator, partial [Deltaproteobacteria bacterium]|nr:TetR/AcrR family transcriptional regulator [Deltaproteobacteria bacterium]
MRHTILSSALKAIAIFGTPKFSIKDVARIAGVSPASVYYYFGSRQNLHKETVEQYFFPLFRRIGAAVRELPDVMELLVEIFRIIQSACESDTNFFWLYANMTFHERFTLRDMPAYCLPEFQPRLRERLAEAQENGELNPDLILELTYHSAISSALFSTGCIENWGKFWGKRFDKRKARDHFLYAFCRAAEGPRCAYPWREILFPDGPPAAPAGAWGGGG